MIEELSEIPEKMEKVLEQAPMIKDISRMFTYAHNFLYLGRGVELYNCCFEPAYTIQHIVEAMKKVTGLTQFVPWFTNGYLSCESEEAPDFY